MSEPLRLAVLGDPIGHSLSPAIFHWLGQELGEAWSYEALRVSRRELPAAVLALKAGEFHGYSITLPHKEAAVGLADTRDHDATRVGAANCLIRTPQGKVRAANTDVFGVRRALRKIRLDPQGKLVLVLGAGGAARACVAALLELGAGKVVVANRTLERARTLASHFEDDRIKPVSLQPVDLAPFTAECALVINATSVGLDHPEERAWPRMLGWNPQTAALDLVYRPVRTAFIRRAEKAGAPVIDGLWVLAFQAVAQLQLWTGHVASDELVDRLHQHLLAGQA